MRRAGFVLLPLVVAVTAWMARNEAVVGRPVLSTEAGYQFWLAHNPWTFSRYPAESIDRSRDVAFASMTPAEMQEIEALSHDEAAASDRFWQKGFAYIDAEPGMALSGALRKIAAGFSWVVSPRREPLVQTVYLLSYGPVLALGLLGMAMTWREWRVHSLIYLQFAAFVLVSAIFWAHTSHRSHLDVYLIVFASVAAQRLAAATGLWRPRAIPVMSPDATR